MIPQEVKVAVDVYADASAAIRVSVLSPLRIRRLAELAAIRIGAGVDEDVQGLHHLADLARGKTSVAVAQSGSPVKGLQQVGRQRYQRIRRHPFPGVHTAKDQHAVVFSVRGTQTENMRLAPLMGEVGNGDQLRCRRVGCSKVL